MPDVKSSSVQGWTRFHQALAKTRGRIAATLGGLLNGTGSIDQQTLDELETSLLLADVGTEATQGILDSLRKKLNRRQLGDRDALLKAIESELLSIAGGLEKAFTVAPKRPFVVLIVGVNGVGKTTTIGKLAHRFKTMGHSVMLAAGDTFRAAAIEQLQAWGETNSVPVIAQRKGSDSASVVHDAIQAARARSIDVLLADTAGRLHSKSHLMEELAKVRRVANRLDADAPHECILVLDATAGQNTLMQIREFDRAVSLTGLILTKLDGTAKGGVVLAIPSITSVPLYFVGMGESLDALREFDARAYVSGLLAQ